ncbi:asparagine synthetase B family protein [Novosphingobium beihaiensis]|uniref:asparagine synthase (glutamine-hydrolyzing) n=1 Tax=Novosphingobium beihaiensis TaxID=2930389 RepID=A0ABT0BW46_9SPHN|nr:asparagine synthase-related protein [Novosphingobium beihaiensis]MCJ2189232.1 asparagine synthase-related protein [Novosphingobium beihaiensis]
MGFCGGTGSGFVRLEAALQILRLGPGRNFPKRTQDDVKIGCCDDSVIAADDHRIAVFNGRLDYVDSLRSALGESARAVTNPAQIMLAAHAKWGIDFCEHLIGDYSCALWDGREKRMILAVDPFALRPLYYWQDGDRLLFATEMRALLSDPAIPRVLDQKMMADILAVQPCDPMRTMYQGICRIPGGHSVIWEKGRIRSERWWRPEQLATLRFRSDRDYEEALREAFEAAVACRIGTSEPIGTHLSGGLDSSSVTALAARQLAAQGRELTAYTATPRHDFTLPQQQFGDEWGHAALVAERYPNIRHHRIDNDAVTYLEALQAREMAHEWPMIGSVNLRWGDAIERDARDRGIKILLFGQIGNMTVSYDGVELFADQLRSGRWGQAFLTARRSVRSGAARWPAVANETARLMLPRHIHRRLLAIAGKREMGLRDYSLINSDFAEEAGIAEAANATGGNMRNVPHRDGLAFRLSVLTRMQHNFGDWVAATRRLYNIEIRDPTADRRLAELCFAIPQEQFIKAGVPRSLLRRAMRGILPDTLVDERRRGKQSADWTTSYAAERPELQVEARRLRHSDFARTCLDLDRMEAMLENWKAPAPGIPADPMEAIILMRGLAAGRFIRRFEGGNG